MAFYGKKVEGIDVKEGERKKRSDNGKIQ